MRDKIAFISTRKKNDTTPNFVDQRKEERYTVNEQCILEIEGKSYYTVLINDSFTGAAIELYGTDIPLEVGDKLHFTFKKENCIQAIMTAEIRHVEAQNDYIHYGLKYVDGDLKQWGIIVRTLK